MVPDIFALHPSYPNPFNPSTTIRYQTPEQGHISIDIYDISGMKIKSMVNEVHAPGTYQLVWDGTDNRSQNVASGIYFVLLETDSFTALDRVVLIK